MNLFKSSIVFVLIFGLVLSAEEPKKDEKKDGKKKTTIDYGTVIGIDLGTTYSCVGIFKNGRVEIIPNDQGNRITPSYVAFTQDGERLIGDAAKNQLTTNPENTVFDVKRLIGRSYSEPSVQKDAKSFPFKVINKGGSPHIEINVGKESRTFAPEEISAMVLGKMKDIAEGYLGKKVTHAVVTVPAYFNDAQRQATKNAGTIAGLNVLRIINEPTAAAIAYGLDKKKDEKQKKEVQILVFDLGGGTFDVSLLTIDAGVFEVVATNGDTHLGGEDFDQRVIEYFLNLYRKKSGGKDASKDQRAVQKLRREVEKAKRALSSAHTARVEVESLYDGEDFSETLSRAKFEELNIDLFRKTLKPVAQVLKDASLKKTDVHEIVLVGGSTRIPKVQQLVQNFFDGKSPNKGINPDEAVAYGAAVQAGVLGGDTSTGELLLLDVCPLTLGTEVDTGLMAKMIPRNTPIPTMKKDMFTTVQDNQNQILIAVYEGERAMAKDNHFLGQFDLTGIPPAPRGVPQVEVTFEIDVNGILTVSAEDKASGNKQQIVIRNDQKSMKPEDIERMVNDAEKFKEADKQVQERVEARSELEQYAYSMRNQMQGQLGKKLSGPNKLKADKALRTTIEWLDNNKEAKKEDYDKQRRDLEEILSPIVTEAYGPPAGGPGGQGGPRGPQTGSAPPPPEGEKKDEL